MYQWTDSLFSNVSSIHTQYQARDIKHGGRIGNANEISPPTSGVWSWRANPVPPVVTIRLTWSSASAHRCTDLWIWVMSSGTMAVTGTSHLSPPSVEKVSVRTWPALSVDGSSEAVSEMMRMAGFSFGAAMISCVGQRHHGDRIQGHEESFYRKTSLIGKASYALTGPPSKKYGDPTLRAIIYLAQKERCGVRRGGSHWPRRGHMSSPSRRHSQSCQNQALIKSL
jgi:hypothetical protein